MSFKGNSNGSLSFKKFTNNRYNVELFEQPENPTAIDKITKCVCKPGLEEDELIGLVYPSGKMVLQDGAVVYAWNTCIYTAKVVYDGKVVDGLYYVGANQLLDLVEAYSSQYNLNRDIYIAQSGRIIRLTKDTPWQTIVDYLDSLNGGE